MAISGSIFGLGVVLASEPVRHRCPETPPKCPETPPKIRAKPIYGGPNSELIKFLKMLPPLRKVNKNCTVDSKHHPKSLL